MIFYHKFILDGMFSQLQILTNALKGLKFEIIWPTANIRFRNETNVYRTALVSWPNRPEMNGGKIPSCLKNKHQQFYCWHFTMLSISLFPLVHPQTDSTCTSMHERDKNFCFFWEEEFLFPCYTFLQLGFAEK